MSQDFLIMTTHKSGPYAVTIGLKGFLDSNKIFPHIIMIQMKQTVFKMSINVLIVLPFLKHQLLESKEHCKQVISIYKKDHGKE